MFVVGKKNQTKISVVVFTVMFVTYYFVLDVLTSLLLFLFFVACCLCCIVRNYLAWRCTFKRCKRCCCACDVQSYLVGCDHTAFVLYSLG